MTSDHGYFRQWQSVGIPCIVCSTIFGYHSNSWAFLLFSFYGVGCFRRQSSSRAHRFVVVRVEQCVAVSAHPHPPWGMLQRHTHPLLRHPWLVQTLAACVRLRRRTAHRRLPWIRRQSRLTIMPAIHWLVQGQWEQRGRVAMLSAVRLCRLHRRSEWFRHCSSRHRDMGARCLHQCMIFLSDPTFLVGMLTSSLFHTVIASRTDIYADGVIMLLKMTVISSLSTRHHCNHCNNQILHKSRNNT